MKNHVLFKQQILINFIILLILCISILLSVHNYRTDDPEFYYNRARILVEDIMNDIKNENFREADYPYAVFDLTGKAIYAGSGSGCKTGEKYNLAEILNFDNTFYRNNRGYYKASFTVSKNGSVNRFAVFLLPYRLVIRHSETERIAAIFMPILLGTVLSVLILTARSIYLKRHILNPIEEISKSSRAIMRGNYDLPVVNSAAKRLLHSEADELAFGFELMRDELKGKEIKEEQLKRSQKELICCISHDLKTPISTIKAYSEGLRDGFAVNPEKQKKYAGIILGKAEVLTKMINDLLEHSSAELNELKIEKKEVYFADYFQKTMKEIKLYTAQKGVILQYNGNTANLLINMDEGRITQVIYNLVENSLKYMDKKGGLIVISSGYRSGDRKLYVSVKDNGSGIDTADIPYIFDKFYRAEKSRSMSIPGSGLGLSISKYIIEKHGGTISCTSKQGEGTEFIFTLDSADNVI